MYAKQPKSCLLKTALEKKQQDFNHNWIRDIDNAYLIPA